MSVVAAAPSTRTAAVTLLAAAFLSACGGGGGSSSLAPAPPAAAAAPAPPSPQPGTGPQSCVNDRAGDFPCAGLSLQSRVPLGDMGGTGGNDLWGWADAPTGREYALMGMTDGTAFVDVSAPRSPVLLGRLPTHTEASLWRDIKVYRDHAFIVADDAGAHGMQVFDLTRLRGVSSPQAWEADVVYGDFTHAHNLAVNERTGFAYAVSTDTCGHGLHMIDLRTPNNPLFAGCHDTVRPHDTQCVVYGGPDAEHRAREICFSSNEDHVEVVDVTDRSAPLSLASTTYPQLAYVHQGWLTEDHRFFLLGDEPDEQNHAVPTRTHVFDMADLDAPAYLYAHELETTATDHNLYVHGKRVFEANYRSGVRVLEFGDLAAREIREVAFFDTFPEGDGPGFEGAWSVYPWLPSGTVLVSDIQGGLFVLSMPYPSRRRPRGPHGHFREFETGGETSLASCGDPPRRAWRRDPGHPPRAPGTTAGTARPTLSGTSPHIAPGAVMIAEDFRPVRVLATEKLAVPRVEGACARTGRKDRRGRGQRFVIRRPRPRFPVTFVKPRTCAAGTSGLVQYAG